jgi:pimeloyl-ACP methyl ester carboxylesterase
MRKAAGLEYEEHGSGEPVLLIHGAIVTDAMLPLAREAALAERHRVIRYRRRAHGASDPLDGPFTLAGQAGDAVALLDELGVGRAHVVGHSGGGAIATQLAIQAPERVHTLSVLEPAIIPPEILAAFPQMSAPVADAYHAGDTQGALDAWMNLVSCGPNWRAEAAMTVPDALDHLEHDAQTFFELEFPTLSEWLFDADTCGRITQPVLLVTGGASGPMVEALKQHFLSLVPAAESVVLPGINHLMQMQDPKAVGAAVATFLSRHPI